MKQLSGPVFLLLLASVSSAHARQHDPKTAGGLFDAAATAAHLKVEGISGPESVTISTKGCTTELRSAKDVWTIDWTSASVNDGDSTASVLMVNMGPDQEMALRSAVPTQLRIARGAAKSLAISCGG